MTETMFDILLVACALAALAALWFDNRRNGPHGGVA
jgi:hypothetical protein